MNKLSVCLLTLFLGLPLLVGAQTADSTGNAKLSGVTATTPPDSWVSPPITDTGGTIQAWLNANAGKRFILPTNGSWPMSLYVTTASACMQYYYGGWHAFGGGCVSASSPKNGGNSFYCDPSGYGTYSIPWMIEVTSYGWVGMNMYNGSGSATCAFVPSTYSSHINSNSPTY